MHHRLRTHLSAAVTQRHTGAHLCCRRRRHTRRGRRRGRRSVHLHRRRHRPHWQLPQRRDGARLLVRGGVTLTVRPHRCHQRVAPSAPVLHLRWKSRSRRSRWCSSRSSGLHAPSRLGGHAGVHDAAAGSLGLLFGHPYRRRRASALRSTVLSSSSSSSSAGGVGTVALLLRC